jgi:hypothetical protein
VTVTTRSRALRSHARTPQRSLHIGGSPKLCRVQERYTNIAEGILKPLFDLRLHVCRSARGVVFGLDCYTQPSPLDSYIGELLTTTRSNNRLCTRGRTTLVQKVSESDVNNFFSLRVRYQSLRPRESTRSNLGCPLIHSSSHTPKTYAIPSGTRQPRSGGPTPRGAIIQP